MTSDHEQDRHAQHMVLLEIVELHPERLTPDELVIRLEAEPVVIVDALDALKRGGLVRLTGEVIEPTHATAQPKSFKSALSAAVDRRPA